MKKSVFLLLFACMIFSVVSIASAEKMDIATTKEAFVSGENITFKVSLLDSNNNPLDASIKILVEDAENKIEIEKEVYSNKFVDLNLGENAPAGYWKITASYNSISATSLFMVETKELIDFQLDNNVLTVINTGNTQYSKPIQIVIGDTIGTKQIDLEVGKRTSFRLVAPDGTYSIKVTDGKTTFTKGGVALTGNVIGVLDNRQLSSNPLTSGVKGEEASYGEDNPVPQNKSFVYIFLFVLFGAAILIGLERKYKKSALRPYPKPSVKDKK